MNGARTLATAGRVLRQLGHDPRSIILKNAAAVGFNKPIYNSYGAASPQLIEQAGAASSFPQAGARRETLKLTASYALQDNLTLLGSFWHERYAAVDWHLDGVGPATVPNLLTLGIQPPNYSVQVLRAAVRYRF